MDENAILREDTHNEEWWQPELHCEKCGCTFMWTYWPDFSDYPKFCPNCGRKFTGLRKGNVLSYNLNKALQNVNN